MKTMMLGLLAAATALTATTNANAALVVHSDVGGYHTFADTSTGLTWLKLDQMFGETYAQQVGNATSAGFVVADAAAISVLQSGSAAINQGTDEWNAVAAITGRSGYRALIWGNYADTNGTNAWSYAYSGDLNWNAYNPGSGSANSDLSLFAYVNATPSVPEPASWAMMILGMGAIGYTLRSAKRRSEAKFDAKIKAITYGATA